MPEKQEIITSNGHRIEKTTVGDVPAQLELPQDGNRLVIGATEGSKEVKGESGLEIVPLAGYPRTPEGWINYNGQLIQPDLEAIIIDPLKAPDFKNGVGYKGLRKNELISSKKLEGRFDKQVGFGVALDKDGKLMVDNADPEKPVDILLVKPPEVAEETEAAEAAKKLYGLSDSTELAEPTVDKHEVLMEEAVGELGEKATENTTEVTTEEDESAETPTAAQLLRNDMQAAVLDAVPLTPEVEKEKILSMKDQERVHSVVEELGRLADVFKRYDDRQRFEEHIHAEAGSLSQMFEKGEIGPEAYAFINGALLAASEDGNLMTKISKDLAAQKVITQGEADKVDKMINTMVGISGEKGNFKEEATQGYIETIQGVAFDTLNKSEKVITPAYMNLLGMVAGMSTKLSVADHEMAVTIRRAAISRALSLTK